MQIYVSDGQILAEVKDKEKDRGLERMMETGEEKDEDLTLEESFAKLEELLLVLENRETTLEAVVSDI